MTDLPEPPTDLSDLMRILSTKGVDELTALPKQDLDKIIAYQRKQRMTREAGGRTKRVIGEAPAVDIKALLGKIQKPAVPVTGIPASKPAPLAPGKGFIRRF